MTAPITTWAVTKLAHPAVRDFRPECADCIALTETAITHAAVTGSVGATCSEGEHSVTVARAHAVYDRPGGRRPDADPDPSTFPVDLHEFASMIGVTPDTLRTYRHDGRLPPPDGRLGGSDVWLPNTVRTWQANRPRPRNAPNGAISRRSPRNGRVDGPGL